ncbi:MAG: hypothetical protein V1901_04400 [Patescibacteria group bacterium]
MLIRCPKYNLYIEEQFDCARCIHYTLTDVLQGEIVGYCCEYEKKEKIE